MITDTPIFVVQLKMRTATTTAYKLSDRSLTRLYGRYVSDCTINSNMPQALHICEWDVLLSVSLCGVVHVISSDSVVLVAKRVVMIFNRQSAKSKHLVCAKVPIITDVYILKQSTIWAVFSSIRRNHSLNSICKLFGSGNYFASK